MGIVAEFYRVEDDVIDYYIQHLEQSNYFFYENFSLIDGEYHNEPDRHFYTDKAWNIAMFLLKECDQSENKLLSGINGQLFDPEDSDTPSYIKSKQAREITDVLEKITETDLQKAFDPEKMKAHGVYRADWFLEEDWQDYILIHTRTLIAAFLAAKKYGDGIVIYYC